MIREATCSFVLLSEIVPSGAYVVPLTEYSATTGTSFAEWSTDTCTGKANVNEEENERSDRGMKNLLCVN